SLITVIGNHHIHRTSANLTQFEDFVTAVRDSLRGLSGITCSRLGSRFRAYASAGRNWRLG
ncbi:MAG: hypothetical protein WBE74_05300, partial [Terracidiphilus sp.]